MAENGDLKSARVIFIMGGPGSGKATQCEKLVSTYGLTHLSTGELLRTEIALGAGSAYRLRRTMLNNDLVPVADVLRLLGNAMRARLLDSPGFLINGCPKDREQAMAFEMMLVPCRVVVFLDVPEDVMWQRLMRRGRRTDQEEVIQKKIKTFREKTLSVVKYFERQGKLVRVDGTGTVSEVFSRVRDGLMNFRPKTASKQPANAARGKMSSRVMAFKAAVARHPADGKAHRAAKDADIKSNKTSDSIPSNPTKGVKTGSTDSSSPSHKHKKKQANPGQKQQKQHGHQSQQKSDRDEAKHKDQPSPRHRQGKKEHEPAAKQQTPEKQHHQAAKQKTPEKQHHQAAKQQTPEKQHHQAAKQQTPEKQHHQAAKQQTPQKQHHQAAKQQTPQKQHHQAAKQQTPEKHHQAAKQNAFDKNHQSKKADQQKI